MQPFQRRELIRKYLPLIVIILLIDLSYFLTLKFRLDILGLIYSFIGTLGLVYEIKKVYSASGGGYYVERVRSGWDTTQFPLKKIRMKIWLFFIIVGFLFNFLSLTNL